MKKPRRAAEPHCCVGPRWFRTSSCSFLFLVLGCEYCLFLFSFWLLVLLQICCRRIVLGLCSFFYFLAVCCCFLYLCTRPQSQCRERKQGAHSLPVAHRIQIAQYQVPSAPVVVCVCCYLLRVLLQCLFSPFSSTVAIAARDCVC